MLFFVCFTKWLLLFSSNFGKQPETNSIACVHTCNSVIVVEKLATKYKTITIRGVLRNLVDITRDLKRMKIIFISSIMMILW